MKKQNNNTSVADKVALRRLAVGWVGGDSGARVLDCFAGAGMMRDRAYPEVAAYLGMEREAEHARPGVWLGDNVHMIPTAFEVQHNRGWNLIDLDAHGNPYVALYQVGRYAPAGPYAVVFTDGMMRSMIGAKVSQFVRWATKFPGDDGRGLIRWYDDFVRWALSETPRMKVREVKRIWKNPASKSAVYYAMRCEFAGPAIGMRRQNVEYH